VDLGPHAAFILAAYAAAVLVIAGLTLWVAADYRTQRRALAELEERGLTRRSATGLRKTAEPMRSEAT
jgi:heme exporter protein D